MDIFKETKKFYKAADGEKCTIGKSISGRPIYAVLLGEGRPTGIAQYAIHGREWITARLAFEHFRFGLKRGSVWLIPLMNPDGALLSQRGIGSVRDEMRAAFLSEINGGSDFSLWKANAAGVDLNVNFDADWGEGKRNVFSPSGENYIGPFPFSEPETRALKMFTEKIRPDFPVSYHTKGEEIYWYYGQPLSSCVRDKRMAMALSKARVIRWHMRREVRAGIKIGASKSSVFPRLRWRRGRTFFPTRSGGNRSKIYGSTI